MGTNRFARRLNPSDPWPSFSRSEAGQVTPPMSQVTNWWNIIQPFSLSPHSLISPGQVAPSMSQAAIIGKPHRLVKYNPLLLYPPITTRSTVFLDVSRCCKILISSSDVFSFSHWVDLETLNQKLFSPLDSRPLLITTRSSDFLDKSLKIQIKKPKIIFFFLHMYVCIYVITKRVVEF